MRLPSVRSIALAQIVLALCACAASAPEVDRQFLTGREARKGIVVFSATHTGPYINRLNGELGFRCESGGEGKVDDYHGVARYIDGERLPIPIGNPTLRSDRPMGRIHILELPTGTCVFNSYSAAAVGHTARTTLSMQPFAIRFIVPDGGVAYVGNYNMDWSPGGARRSFNDYYERDLAVLKAQNFSLPGPVAKRIGTAAGL